MDTSGDAVETRSVARWQESGRVGKVLNGWSMKVVESGSSQGVQAPGFDDFGEQPSAI